MRIASVARIAGPSEDGQFFMVTRYDGLLGRLLGRKMFAVVRFESDGSCDARSYWGSTQDATNEDVLSAVLRFDRKETRRLERARLRGDAYWQPFTQRGQRLLVSATWPLGDER